MYNSVEIVVGTYEEYLLGYRCQESQKDKKLTLTQSFATRSHTASIRCVASYGKYLASGGADDRVFVYNMNSRKEIQILLHHKGTVNAIAFAPEGSHIFTGGDDEQMYAVRLNTWQLEGVWKKRGAITRISCHPSGKLALTLSSDFVLRTWNLVKGRLAYAINLKTNKAYGGQPDCVSWSQDGEHFALTGLRVVEIWNTQSGTVIQSHSTKSKPTALCWLSEHDLVVGLEDGKIILMHTQESFTTSFQAHIQRVKDMAFANEILATASSSGEISLWTIDIINKSHKKLCSTNTGCRPTCLTIVDLTQFGDGNELKKETADEQVQENSSNKQFSRIGKVSVTMEVEDDDEEEQTQKPEKDAGKQDKQPTKKRQRTEETKQHPKKKKKKPLPSKAKKYDSEEGSDDAQNVHSFKTFKKKKLKKLHENQKGKLQRTSKKKIMQRKSK